MPLGTMAVAPVFQMRIERLRVPMRWAPISNCCAPLLRGRGLSERTNFLAMLAAVGLGHQRHRNILDLWSIGDASEKSLSRLENPLNTWTANGRQMSLVLSTVITIVSLLNMKA